MFFTEIVGREEIKKTKIFLQISCVQWLVILFFSWTEYEALLDIALNYISRAIAFVIVILLGLNLLLPIFLLALAAIYFPFYLRKYLMKDE